MLRMFVRLLPACLSLLMLAGCVALPPATVEPLPGAPTFTPTSVETPEAQPVQARLRVHPPSSRTGLPEVDRVIDAVLSGDRDLVRSFVHFLTTPCTTREGLGGPPKCGPGESDGKPVEVFPVGGPEGSFVRPDEIERVLPGPVRGLYAVYRVPASAYREAYWPAGDYAIVFLNPDDSFLFVRVSADGIVLIDHPFVSAGDLAGRIGGEAVLAPPGP